MKISDVMTRAVATVSPHDPIRKAAQMMDDLDVGALPVCDADTVVGMVTDRDITIRATSAGRDPDRCVVDEVMTAEVEYCFVDDSTDAAAERMKARQIRRLPVIDRSRKLVGIVALGDIASKSAAGGTGRRLAEETLRRVSEPPVPDRPSEPAGAAAYSGSKPAEAGGGSGR